MSQIRNRCHIVVVMVLLLLGLVTAKSREFKSALPLLMISLDHPATVAETKVKADALAVEVKAQMTPEEVESAQVLMENKAFETVVQRILGMAE